MDFKDQIDFHQNTKAALALPDHFDAVLIIDPQAEFAKRGGTFCRGNHETELIAAQIKTLTPIFREAGLPIYTAYYGEKYHPQQGRHRPHEIDFYGYKYDPSDTLIYKEDNSAFDETDLRKILKQKKHQNILVLGFNTSACITDTVLDGQKLGFQCWVITDGIGDDNEHNGYLRERSMQQMTNAGAQFLLCKNALAKLALSTEQIKSILPAAPLALSETQRLEDKQARDMQHMAGWQR